MFGFLLMISAWSSECARIVVFVSVWDDCKSTDLIPWNHRQLLLFPFCREIVVDDLQISKVQTTAPTRSPTAALMDDVEEVETSVAPTGSVSCFSLCC